MWAPSPGQEVSTESPPSLMFRQPGLPQPADRRYQPSFEERFDTKKCLKEKIKMLVRDCWLDALVFFNQRSFQHCRPAWFVRYPKYHHVGPLVPTFAISIQII